MLFNSNSYEILYEQFHWIYLQGDIKLLLVTVNNRLKFEIEIVHDLSCHPIYVQEDLPQWRHKWRQSVRAASAVAYHLMEYARSVVLAECSIRL